MSFTLSGLSLSGLGVALATPFTPSGEVDLPAFRRLVRHCVEGGVDFLVPLGSTGEAATLLEAERDAVIAACVEEAAGRPVIAGTGSNATRQAQAWTKRAQALGATGALVVTPYYNKPTLAGLVAHFESVASAAPGLPLVLYNVPGRTGQNVTPPMLARLWENEAIIAVKESSGNLAQIGEIARTLPPGRALLSGDDALALPSLALGAHGLVSVLGNLLPAQAKAMVAAALSGDARMARTLHHRMLPLMDALFLESNPGPLKAGLRQLGLSEDVLRLPLVSTESSTRAKLLSALEAAR